MFGVLMCGLPLLWGWNLAAVLITGVAGGMFFGGFLSWGIAAAGREGGPR